MPNINKLYLIGAGIMLTISLISGEVHEIAIDELQYSILIDKVPIESYPQIRYILDWIFFIGFIGQAISTGFFLHKSKLLQVIWSKWLAD